MCLTYWPWGQPGYKPRKKARRQKGHSDCLKRHAGGHARQAANWPFLSLGTILTR